jgi:hypothetical protein
MTETVVAELQVATLLKPNPAIGHDPERVT